MLIQSRIGSDYLINACVTAAHLLAYPLCSRLCAQLQMPVFNAIKLSCTI